MSRHIHIVRIDTMDNGGMQLFQQLGADPVVMVFEYLKHALAAAADLRNQMIAIYGSDRGECIDIQITSHELYKTNQYMRFTFNQPGGNVLEVGTMDSPFKPKDGFSSST